MKYLVLICFLIVCASVAKSKRTDGLQGRYDVPPGASVPSDGSSSGASSPGTMNLSFNTPTSRADGSSGINPFVDDNNGAETGTNSNYGTNSGNNIGSNVNQPPNTGSNYETNSGNNNGYQPGLANNGYQPGLGNNGYQPSLGNNGYQPGLANNGYQPGLATNGYQPGLANNVSANGGNNYGGNRGNEYGRPVNGYVNPNTPYNPYLRPNPYGRPVNGYVNPNTPYNPYLRPNPYVNPNPYGRPNSGYVSNPYAGNEFFSGRKANPKNSTLTNSSDKKDELEVSTTQLPSSTTTKN